jgi:hypothetical protein
VTPAYLEAVRCAFGAIGALLPIDHPLRDTTDPLVTNELMGFGRAKLPSVDDHDSDNVVRISTMLDSPLPHGRYGRVVAVEGRRHVHVVGYWMALDWHSTIVAYRQFCALR